MAKLDTVYDKLPKMRFWPLISLGGMERSIEGTFCIADESTSCDKSFDKIVSKTVEEVRLEKKLE